MTRMPPAVEMDVVVGPKAEGARRATGAVGPTATSAATAPDPEVPAKAQREDDLETLTQPLLTLEHGEEIRVDTLDGPLAAILLSPRLPSTLDVGIPGLPHLWVVIEFNRGVVGGLTRKGREQLGELEG